MPYIDKDFKPTVFEYTNVNDYNRLLVYYPRKGGRRVTDPFACDFTFSPIFPQSPTPTSTVTPTITPTTSVTPTPSITPSVTVTPTPSPSPIAFDSDAAAYLSDVIASGGTTNATISGATDTLFKDLKSAGLYSKLDLFYPFVGGTAASHAINALRNKTYDISWNGGMTHGVSGSTGNGSNGWGDLTFAIDDLTTRTLGSWGLYITDANSASNNGLHGNFDADRTTIAPYRATSTVNRYNFMYSPSPGISQPTNIDGNHTVVRTGTTEFAVYVNETQHATASGYSTAAATNLMSLFVFTASGSPTAGTYRDDTLGFCYFGSDIDYSETITLQGIINDFQTALSRNTY